MRGGTPPPWLLVVITALAGGLAMSWSFPQPGWHGLMIPGVMAVLLSTRLATTTGGLVLSAMVSGLAFHLTLLRWTTLFLGALPWLALSLLMALMWAVGMVSIGLAYRWGLAEWVVSGEVPGSRRARLLAGVARWGLVPVLVASLWAAREVWSGSWPYGGFAWGRVAQSLAPSPMIDLVSWLGLIGTGWVMVVFAAVALEAIRVLVAPGGPRRARAAMARGLPLAALVLVLLGMVVVPGYRVPTHGTVRMAGIQGGDETAGYFMGGSRGDIFAAHRRANALLDPQADVDVIVWPEGAAEWDPYATPQVAAILDDIVATHDAPMLVGAPREEGDRVYQSVVQYPGHGGEPRAYDKRNPVPFGEYVPHREFYGSIVPDLIGLISRDYTPGTSSPVVPVESATSGAAPVGVFICFDVIDDALGREAVRGGAEWLVTPSNNADFGRTDELAQQVAFARLRAVETGRAMVQVSTVGFTAAFGPDGRVLAHEDWYTPAAMVVDVPLSTALTPAVRFGRAWEVAPFVVGLVGLAAVGFGASRQGRRRVG